MKEEGAVSYPLMKGHSGWGIFCHHDSTPTIIKGVGEVICRQTRGEFLLEVSNTSTLPVSYDGALYSGSISCSATRNFLSECAVNVRPQSSCASGYTTVQCTSGIYNKCRNNCT